jgi:hypothetical protein
MDERPHLRQVKIWRFLKFGANARLATIARTDSEIVFKTGSFPFFKSISTLRSWLLRG